MKRPECWASPGLWLGWSLITTVLRLQGTPLNLTNLISFQHGEVARMIWGQELDLGRMVGQVRGPSALLRLLKLSQQPHNPPPLCLEVPVSRHQPGPLLAQSSTWQLAPGPPTTPTVMVSQSQKAMCQHLRGPVWGTLLLLRCKLPTLALATAALGARRGRERKGGASKLW